MWFFYWLTNIFKNIINSAWLHHKSGIDYLIFSANILLQHYNYKIKTIDRDANLNYVLNYQRNVK